MSSTSWINRDKRLAIYDRDDFKCLWCGKRLFIGIDRLSLDHLKPRTKNGKHHESNLITSCESCNSSRQDKPWKKFAANNDVIAKINKHRRRSIKSRRKFAKKVIEAADSWEESLLSALYDD